MQRGVGIRHWYQPSLRDVRSSYHTLAINHQAIFILPQRGFHKHSGKEDRDAHVLVSGLPDFAPLISHVCGLLTQAKELPATVNILRFVVSP